MEFDMLDYVPLLVSKERWYWNEWSAQKHTTETEPERVSIIE